MQIGYTALMGAAHANRAECVRLLLEAGADTEAKSNVRHNPSYFAHVVLQILT